MKIIILFFRESLQGRSTRVALVLIQKRAALPGGLYFLYGFSKYYFRVFINYKLQPFLSSLITIFFHV